MPDETIKTEEVKKTSDGSVKIALERYEELLRKSAEKAPVMTTIVHKTPEILAQEHRAIGATFMGLSVCSFVVGALLYKSGVNQASNLGSTSAAGLNGQS